MSGRNIDKIKEIFSTFVDIVCSKGYQRYGDDDILNGRAGFLLAVQMIKNETGKYVLTENEIKRVLWVLIQSGREYSQENQSPAPLFYEWHGKEYLGTAHGLAGILQACLA